MTFPARLFCDTSFFYACFDQHDVNHERAKQISEEAAVKWFRSFRDSPSLRYIPAVDSQNSRSIVQPFNEIRACGNRSNFPPVLPDRNSPFGEIIVRCSGGSIQFNGFNSSAGKTEQTCPRRADAAVRLRSRLKKAEGEANY